MSFPRKFTIDEHKKERSVNPIVTKWFDRRIYPTKGLITFDVIKNHGLLVVLETQSGAGFVVVIDHANDNDNDNTLISSIISLDESDHGSGGDFVVIGGDDDDDDESNYHNRRHISKFGFRSIAIAYTPTHISICCGGYDGRKKTIVEHSCCDDIADDDDPFCKLGFGHSGGQCNNSCGLIQFLTVTTINYTI